MYVKTHCTICNREHFVWIALDGFEKTEFADQSSAMRYLIDNVEVQENITKEDLVSRIIKTIGNHIHNGISIMEVNYVLQHIYGVASAYCSDMIQSILIELDMYCPDRKHLYYVNA